MEHAGTSIRWNTVQWFRCLVACCLVLLASFSAPARGAPIFVQEDHIQLIGRERIQKYVDMAGIKFDSLVVYMVGVFPSISDLSVSCLPDNRALATGESYMYDWRKLNNAPTDTFCYVSQDTGEITITSPLLAGDERYTCSAKTLSGKSEQFVRNVLEGSSDAVIGVKLPVYHHIEVIRHVHHANRYNEEGVKPMSEGLRQEFYCKLPVPCYFIVNVVEVADGGSYQLVETVDHYNPEFVDFLKCTDLNCAKTTAYKALDSNVYTTKKKFDGLIHEIVAKDQADQGNFINKGWSALKGFVTGGGFEPAERPTYSDSFMTKCDPGYFLIDELACFPCWPGTYPDGEGKTCLACQDNMASGYRKESCKRCTKGSNKDHTVCNEDLFVDSVDGKSQKSRAEIEAEQRKLMQDQMNERMRELNASAGFVEVLLNLIMSPTGIAVVVVILGITVVLGRIWYMKEKRDEKKNKKKVVKHLAEHTEDVIEGMLQEKREESAAEEA